MHILIIFLSILAVYFFLVFVGLRLIVPFMGFRKFRVPEQLTNGIEEEIKELESKSSTQLEYLTAAYNFVTSRWYAGRMNTVLYFPLAFRTNLEKIWQPGYAHCNTMNYLLFVLLVKSKYFTPQDITVHHVFFNMFIHQYMQVKVGNKWLDADPAGAHIRGLSLGKHISIIG